jgi:AcrR family transcriptional regulator
MMSVLDRPSMNRAERRRQQTYMQLKQAAAEVLGETGYRNFTIKAVTERADVGYGTFYLHFKDKDDIVWAVIQDIIAVWWDDMMAKLKDIPFPRREYLSWVYLFELTDSVRDEFSAMFGTGGSTTLLKYYQEYVSDLHVRNMRAGTFSANLDVPIEWLAQFMTGALVRLMVWWVETPNDYTPEQMAALMYQTAYRQPPPLG